MKSGMNGNELNAVDALQEYFYKKSNTLSFLKIIKIKLINIFCSTCNEKL